MFGFLEKIVHGTNDFDAKYENVCQKPKPHPKKDSPVVEKPVIVDLDGYYETQNDQYNNTNSMLENANGKLVTLHFRPQSSLLNSFYKYHFCLVAFFMSQVDYLSEN